MYETVLHVIKRGIDMGTTITLENLKEDLRRVYAQRYVDYKERIHAESVLYTNANFNKGKNFKFKKPFKGDCRICGKKGHKAADCWEQEKNRDKRPANYRAKSESAYNVADQKKHCNYCGKDNHNIEQCFKKQRDDRKSGTRNKEVTKMVIMAVEDINADMSEHIFIADSGATSHMRNSLHGMYDLKDLEIEVKVGNKATMKSQKIGKF